MGRSHALLMAERGADIIVHDIKYDGAAETAEMVRSKGRKAEVIVRDIRDVAAFQHDVQRAIETFSGLDILVNNTGVGGKRRSIEEIDEAIYDEMFDIHVKGAFFATQAVLPAMKTKNSGRIINISSIYAMGGNKNASHYAAAKAALSCFTKSWARELAPFNIKVNAVAPGFVLTDLTMASNPMDKIREREKTMPLGRFVEPLEISYAVAWLASGETEMITGQVISPNSGEMIM